MKMATVDAQDQSIDLVTIGKILLTIITAILFFLIIINFWMGFGLSSKNEGQVNDKRNYMIIAFFYCYLLYYISNSRQKLKDILVKFRAKLKKKMELNPDAPKDSELTKVLEAKQRERSKQFLLFNTIIGICLTISFWITMYLPGFENIGTVLTIFFGVASVIRIL